MFEPLSKTSKCKCCDNNIIFYPNIKYIKCTNCKARFAVVDNKLEREIINEKSTFANADERREKSRLKLKAISENPISLKPLLKPASLIVRSKENVKTTPVKPEEIKRDLPPTPTYKTVSKVDAFAQLQKACDKVYNGMVAFSSQLDENGGRINAKIRTKAESLDLEIQGFLMLCNSNRNNIGAVMWNNQLTQLIGIILTINAFMSEVLKLTSYRFKSLDWMKIGD